MNKTAKRRIKALINETTPRGRTSGSHFNNYCTCACELLYWKVRDDLQWTKHKLKDFIDATKEEAGNVAVEEVLPAVVKEAGGFIVSEGVGMLASEIVGAVVPVANNIRLSYKQNRMERNVVEAYCRLFC